MKNRFKSIVVTDRYGVKYIKNFTLWADGTVSLQRWTSKDSKVKTVHLR